MSTKTFCDFVTFLDPDRGYRPRTGMIAAIVQAHDSAFDVYHVETDDGEVHIVREVPLDHEKLSHALQVHEALKVGPASGLGPKFEDISKWMELNLGKS